MLDRDAIERIVELGKYEVTAVNGHPYHINARDAANDSTRETDASVLTLSGREPIKRV